ncbi:MAG: peptide deformylase [Rickettsiales bacterium]|jgi:peptide deformylase|nr:peptide deformylase [Rickettsiales bacterium]
MAILPLVTAPDSRLKIKSFPVEKVDDDLRKFMDDMLETMYHCEGIGLAAVQVGVHKRVLVMDLHPDGEKSPLFVINPEIVNHTDILSEYDEGCLSFPGQYATVVRPEKVTVKYLDYHGKEQILECEGLLATCIQHEIDHLNGVVFIDHLSPVKRDMIIRKVKKQKAASED